MRLGKLLAKRDMSGNEFKKSHSNRSDFDYLRAWPSENKIFFPLGVKYVSSISYKSTVNVIYFGCLN